MIDSYKSLCTEFYDLDKPDAPKEALEYYLNEVTNSEQPILEPMCGTGRFLIPVFEKGFDIEGTDASLEMLIKCKLNCSKKKLDPVLHYQKIQRLKLKRNYGLIFIPSGSFGLITEENEVRESLKNLYHYLIPRGQLILEVETPYSQTMDRVDNREVPINDFSKITLTATARFDIKTGIEITDYEYRKIIDNKVTLIETETIKVRHYTISEFSEILQSTGFSRIRTLKPYTNEKATDGDSMIIFKCIKS